ncbi:rhomboid family intramembrane serine protease [bacterium]|nr:rhomboid family intramembrane serine protease [Pseudomonadales bacterium]MDC0317196.1 rhomboid family intramembrane serine protease [bacterium]
MFMHGGIAHLVGNMWFLWVYGDNIEHDMGRVRYLFFYLLTGVLAGLTHVALVCRGDGAMVPCLGASGAISGILGACLVLHPHRRVMVLVWEFMVQVPGYVVIGIWFGLQFLGGLLNAGVTSEIAFGAHLGGFIVGLLLAKLFVLERHGEDGNSSWRDNRIRRKYSGGANVGSE